jgi:hypothetical protein
MRNRFVAVGVAAIAAVGIPLWVSAAGGAHVPPSTAAAAGQTPAYIPPRTPDGKPDLNGIWQALNTANYDLQAHAARPAMALRPGPAGPIPTAPVLALGAVGAVPAGLGVVEGGEIPYQPWAAVKKKENGDNWLASDPEIKCYLPGVPRATYMPFPFQIFQNDRSILLAYEYAGAVRNVYLTDPGPAPIDSWMGQSVGRWDGDTLVITITGFNGQAWFDRAGNFASESLRVVERYTRTGPDHLRYEATIDDAKVFTRPWTISMPLYRRIEGNARLHEFKCVEFVEELMYGHLRKNPIR